jgi:lysophospholipase L1-like esterase
MKKIFIFSIFITMSLFGFAQKDWFGFNRYQADNDRIIANKEYPEVVFMGNSITDNWAYYHPEFFSEHRFCGRGIGGQTSAHMVVRFTADVINLHPKAVVIMAGTNDVAHNDYYVEPEHVVENIVAMCDLAKTHGIIPIICSIPPCSKFPWRPEIENPAQTIVNINKVLKDYAETNGFVYVDFHSAFADEKLGLPKSFSDDGCHPNPESYCPMEEMVLEAIGQALK